MQPTVGRQDCTGCRITGSLTGIGLCGYLLYECKNVVIPTQPVWTNVTKLERDAGDKAFHTALRKASRHRSLLAGMAVGELFTVVES